MAQLMLNLAKSIPELHFLYKTRQHPDVDKMLSGDPPESMDQHMRYMDAVQDKTRWIYIASIRDDVKNNEFLVGYSHIYDVTEKTVTVGFTIHPEKQGNGYGKDLVIKTISKAKEKFPDKKLILSVLRNNSKAIHIYKKLGFVEKNTAIEDFEKMHMELCE